ncbi:uncharacterized protein LOC120353986 isoform X2 [Nilaparvata lugens]|uniref:uncharacterized protein LOC120353986 isoform X2 n=1 Tax=Nilaparvata lugens TaxID=108931 RepID=UPI00193EA308|nr:uncharacterized protein LOC120353986 isoform X2 [Nilaparvata lugens]
MDVLACDQCGSFFKAKKYLKQHLAVHHRVLDVFECYICRKTFGAKYKLTEHFSIVHSGTSYNCEVCGKGFQSKFTLGTHMKKHTGNFEVFTCVECSQEFNRKQLLVEHVGDMNRRCLWCDMWLGCRTKLLEHIEENHRRVGRLECTECRRDVHSLTKFWNHLIVYHPEQCRIVNKNCVICEKCRQLCSSRHHLKKHQRKLCLVSEKNVCKHCNVRLGTNYLHGVHLGRGLRCAMCGERFECLTLLKEHVYYGHRSGEEVLDLEKTCYRRVVNGWKSPMRDRIGERNGSKSPESSRISGRNSSKSPENGKSWRCERDRSVGRIEKFRRSMENCGNGDGNGGEAVGNRCRSGENAGELSRCGRVMENSGKGDENGGKAVGNRCKSSENAGELSGFERVVESCGSRDENLERCTESSGRRRCKGRICLKTGESFRKNLEGNYVEKVVVDKVEKLLGKNGENLRIVNYCRGKNEKPSGNASYGIMKYTVPYSNQVSGNVNWSENQEVLNRCHGTTGCNVSNNEKHSKIVNGCDENSNETISVETKKSVSPSRSFEDVPVPSSSEDEVSLKSGNDDSERDYCSLTSNNYTKVLDCDSDGFENRSVLSIDSSRLSFKFKCYDCENLYQTLKDLECHRRLAHDSDIDVPEIMTCDHCGRQFTKRTLLEGHFRKCVCSICGCTTRCWTLLRLHCSTKHGSRGDWSCDKCRRGFRSSVLFVKHARNCRGIVVRKDRKRRRSEGSKLVKHPKFKRIRTLDDEHNYENCDTNLSTKRTKNKRIPTPDDDDDDNHDNCKTNLSTRGTKYRRNPTLNDDNDDNYDNCKTNLSTRGTKYKRKPTLNDDNDNCKANLSTRGMKYKRISTVDDDNDNNYDDFKTNLSTRGKKYKRIRLLDDYDDDDDIVVNTTDKYCNTYSPTSPTNLKNTATFRIVLKNRSKKISPRNFKGSPKKSLPRSKQKSPQKPPEPSPSKSSTDEDFVKPKLRPKSMTTPQRKRVEFLKSMRENCETSPDKKSPKLKAIRESVTKLEFSPGEDNKIGVGILKSVRKNGETSSEKVGPIENSVLISGRTNNVSPTSNRSIVGNIWRSRRNLGKLTPPKDLSLVEDRNLKGDLKLSPKNSVSDLDGDSKLVRKLKKDFMENLDVKPLDNTLDSTKELIIDTSVSYCQSVNDSFTKSNCILGEEKRINEIPTDVTRTDFFLNLNLVSSTPINGVRKSEGHLFQGKLDGKISGEDLKDGRKFCRQLISAGDTSKVVYCEASPNRVPTSILKTVPSVKSKSTLRRIVHFEDDVDEKFGCKFLKNVSPDSCRSSVDVPSEKNDSNVVVSSAKSENVEGSCKPSSKLQIYRCRLCKKRFPNRDLLQCHITSNVCRVKISNLS